MRRFLLSFILVFISIITVNASEIQNIEYKNIKPNSKIIYNADIDRWEIVHKKDSDYLQKQISAGSGSYSEFYTPDGDFAFSTGCTYEFIHKGDLIGYSNQDLKFYDFALVNNELTKRELREDEVQSLFPNFKIIKISEFSQNTNSLKIKQNKFNQKFILLNDTDMNFYHYSFSTGNSKFKAYDLAGFLEIKKKGMIQFSHFGENTENFPWFILLVR